MNKDFTNLSLTFETGSFSALINKNPLFLSLANFMIKAAGRNRSGKIHLSKEPLKGYSRCTKTGKPPSVGSFIVDGYVQSFNICNSYIKAYNIPDEFYFKIEAGVAEVKQYSKQEDW